MSEEKGEEDYMDLFEVELDENEDPTEQQFIQYAEYIGIHLQTEQHLLYLAQQGISQKLPPQWKLCQNNKQEFVYYNNQSGQMSLDNPVDLYYMQKVKEAREQIENQSIQSSQSKQQETNNNEQFSQIDDYFVDLLMQTDDENKDQLIYQGILKKKQFQKQQIEFQKQLKVFKSDLIKKNDKDLSKRIEQEKKENQNFIKKDCQSKLNKQKQLQKTKMVNNKEKLYKESELQFKKKYQIIVENNINQDCEKQLKSFSDKQKKRIDENRKETKLKFNQFKRDIELKNTSKLNDYKYQIQQLQKDLKHQQQQNNEVEKQKLKEMFDKYQFMEKIQQEEEKIYNVKKQIKEKEIQFNNQKQLSDCSQIIKSNKQQIMNLKQTNNKILNEIKENQQKELKQLKMNQSKKYQIKKDQLQLQLDLNIKQYFEQNYFSKTVNDVEILKKKKEKLELNIAEINQVNQQKQRSYQQIKLKEKQKLQSIRKQQVDEEKQQQEDQAKQYQKDMEILNQNEQNILQNKEKFNVMIQELNRNNNQYQEKLLNKMQNDLNDQHKKLLEKKKRLKQQIDKHDEKNDYLKNVLNPQKDPLKKLSDSFHLYTTNTNKNITQKLQRKSSQEFINKLDQQTLIKSNPNPFLFSSRNSQYNISQNQKTNQLFGRYSFSKTSGDSFIQNTSLPKKREKTPQSSINKNNDNWVASMTQRLSKSRSRNKL